MSVTCSDKRGKKQKLIRAHLLTHAREREESGSCKWAVWGGPEVAEVSTDLLQTEVGHVFSPGNWPRIAGLSAVPGCTSFQESVSSDLLPLRVWWGWERLSYPCLSWIQQPLLMLPQSSDRCALTCVNVQLDAPCLSQPFLAYLRVGMIYCPHATIYCLSGKPRLCPGLP